MNAHYVYTEPDSQFYDDLNQLAQEMRSILYRVRENKLTKGVVGDSGEFWITSVEEDIDYILKGIANSMDKGLNIMPVLPKEGMMRVDVPVGSYILPPDSPEPLSEWKTPLDLATLKYIKQVFGLHSDMSINCNGYRSLLIMINELEKLSAEKEPQPKQEDLDNKIDSFIDALCSYIYDAKEEDFPSNIGSHYIEELKQAIKNLLT